MLVFLSACAALFLGYWFYSRMVEKIFGIMPQQPTPAVAACDNVDYVPLPVWRIFLIQFLNIAGLGPVFGALLGALYGPVALFWIVLGSIFAGGVHDYLAGMISLRNNGWSLNLLVEKYLGNKVKIVFLVFSIFFLLLLGAVFAMSPAQMLADISGAPFLLWLGIIFGYYFLATLLPIDKIIGRFYPLFALLLLGVTLALMAFMLFDGRPLYPNLSLSNQHPQDLPIFPLMFVTIACGALSGFHATQSPLMARCLPNEKNGRAVFYGAMITEGVVALVWATLGMSFYQGSEGLFAVINAGGPGAAVSGIAKGYLGNIGAILTVISVVLLSITSGDTAFRSARLSVADYFPTSKKNLGQRLLISILVLGGGILLSLFDLTVIWTYFGWANQCLATITLWMCCFYLIRKQKNCLIALLPATFMTAVCTSYILYDKIGFRLPAATAQTIGAVLAVVALAAFGFCHFGKKEKHK